LITSRVSLASTWWAEDALLHQPLTSDTWWFRVDGRAQLTSYFLFLASKAGLIISLSLRAATAFLGLVTHRVNIQSWITLLVEFAPMLLFQRGQFMSKN